MSVCMSRQHALGSAGHEAAQIGFTTISPLFHMRGDFVEFNDFT
jgi:hypothetical protein